MTELYLFGCSCGAIGRDVKTVQSKGHTKVYNTKRDSEKLKQHINYLAGAGMDIKGYPAIVVENGGERITLLDEWTRLA